MNDMTKEFQSTYFRLETADEAAILRVCRTRLSDEDNVEQVGFELMNVVDQLGFTRLIVSMKGVEWVTSSILGKLIHLHRHLKRIDGDMVLCDLSQTIDEVMQTSRLDNYFQIAETVEEALQGKLRTKSE